MGKPEIEAGTLQTGGPATRPLLQRDPTAGERTAPPTKLRDSVIHSLMSLSRCPALGSGAKSVAKTTFLLQ